MTEPQILRAVVLVLGLFFLSFVVGLVIAAIVRKFGESETIEAPAPVHVHEWRYVTEFVRQCRERSCGEVEFIDPVPDGMMEYVSLMTAPAARQHPIDQAEQCKHLDSRMWGRSCPDCKRIIPDEPKDNLCPYCLAVL